MSFKNIFPANFRVRSCQSPAFAILFVSVLLSATNAFSDAAGKHKRTLDDWKNILKLAQALPAINPDSDPSSPGRSLVMPVLEKCSYVPHQMEFMDCLVDVFNKGLEKPIEAQKEFILSMLDKMPELSFLERTKLQVGIRADIGMVKAGVTAKNCRSYLKSQFDNGMTRDELVSQIQQRIADLQGSGKAPNPRH